MISVNKFTAMTTRNQVHFLIYELSSPKEVLVFVELAKMQNSNIDYIVLTKSIDVWKSRLEIVDEIEKEYGRYLNYLETKTLEEIRFNKNKVFQKILGIGIQMRFQQSFEEKCYQTNDDDII
jgi:hypothetical protein